MAPKLLVCDGCCCGRMEKGNNAVPIEYLKNAWEENSLQNHVGLSISGFGPLQSQQCYTDDEWNERIWLGELGTIEHYEALVEWAKSISNNQEVSNLPDLLVSHQFKPK